MKYRNAGKLLPVQLLTELQKYAEGELIYVPGRKRKAGWGTLNGSRARYAERNTRMARSFRDGASIEEISRDYFLSTDSVRKILRGMTEGG